MNGPGPLVIMAFVALTAAGQNSDTHHAEMPPQATLRTTLAVGERVRATRRSGWRVICPRGGEWPLYRITVDSVHYDLGVGRRDRRIRYISTSDPRFVTPEGLSLSTTLAGVLAQSNSGPEQASDLAHVVQLPSGWWAAFGSFTLEASPMLEPPTQDAHPRYFFRIDR